MRTDPATVFLFAKFPKEGAVKTRLIPALGAAGAARLAEAFLLDMAQRLAAADLGDARRVLCFDPPESEANFRSLLSENKLTLSLLPQSAGDLGARLAGALKYSPDAPAVFLGTDAPGQPFDELARGLDCARGGRAYIQRACDGGYVLLALPAGTPASVFSEITWSSAQTGAQQISRIRALNIPLVESAQTWPDVDEAADLPELKKRLEAQPKIAPRTLSVLRALG